MAPPVHINSFVPTTMIYTKRHPTNHILNIIPAPRASSEVQQYPRDPPVHPGPGPAHPGRVPSVPRAHRLG